MFSYKYDKRGNIIAEINELSGGKQSYTYDQSNRMVQGVNYQGQMSSYYFNGLGSLVSHQQSDVVKGILLIIT